MTRPLKWYLIYILSVLMGTVVYGFAWAVAPLGWPRPGPYRIVLDSTRAHADEATA